MTAISADFCLAKNREFLSEVKFRSFIHRGLDFHVEKLSPLILILYIILFFVLAYSFCGVKRIYLFYL